MLQKYLPDFRQRLIIEEDKDEGGISLCDKTVLS